MIDSSVVKPCPVLLYSSNRPSVGNSLQSLVLQTPSVPVDLFHQELLLGSSHSKFLLQHGSGTVFVLL